MPFNRKAYDSKTVKDGLRRKVRNAMSAAAEAAADEMRHVIETDTLTRASAERGGGRIETGDMLESVQSTKARISESGKSYQTFFGWSTPDRRSHSDRMTDTNAQYKSYFDLQDKGFTHVAGTQIPGMHAEEAGKRKFREVMEEQWHN